MHFLCYSTSQFNEFVLKLIYYLKDAWISGVGHLVSHRSDQFYLM